MERATKHLTASMLYYMFDAANMHRWNDHYRTVDFTELDKQAHKSAIAWFLAKCEEDKGNTINWNIIIEHSLFGFIHRIAITDLKPPIYYELIKDESNRKGLNNYAYSEFVSHVPDMGPEFLHRFRDYLDNGSDLLEDRILSTAHYLATRYEFNIIEDANASVVDIAETKTEIECQIDRFRQYGLAGLSDTRYHLLEFINLVGQLRCQQRWAKTPREPKTTVLGHCIFVANSVYLNDLDHPCVSDKQIYQDFYSGLFHDLPEVLTKDVITPVKTSSDDIRDMLGHIEEAMLERKVEPFIPESWRDELRAMALRPFEYVESMGERDYDSIKACDHLAAWIEAYVSIQYGVSSKALRDAKVQTGEKLITDGRGEKIGVAKILVDFENMEL